MTSAYKKQYETFTIQKQSTLFYIYRVMLNISNHKKVTMTRSS